MKVRLDIDKIARGRGAERRGKVETSGGYFGALALAADIEARFRVASGGGRPTDPVGPNGVKSRLRGERSSGSRRSPQSCGRARA